MCPESLVGGGERRMLIMIWFALILAIQVSPRPWEKVAI